MRGLESIAESLFEKIRSRFPSITMGDENGAPTSEAKDARFFDFDYVVDGENQGAISISIKEPESLKLYFSQDMLANVSESIEDGWYAFLKEMRFFAKKHMMGFDARDIAKSNLDKRDYKYLSNNTVQESAMYGTSMSSYENLDKTRLIIRHKDAINLEQAGARTRHISSLFIENEAGERFKYPYAHLAGARAMARHVANGGLPHDDFGKHIIETSGNIAKLTAFKRYVGKKDFMNTTSNDIIEGANAELDYLRDHVKKLQGQNYYTQTKENYIAPEMSDDQLGEDIVDELTNAFTIPQFNEELKDMFPLLHKIHQKRVSETTVNLDSMFDEQEDDGPWTRITGRGNLKRITAPAGTVKVGQGMTLFGIAQMFNDQNNMGGDVQQFVRDIMELNGITNPQGLQIGQVLKMPYSMGTGPDGASRGLPPRGFLAYESASNDPADEFDTWAESMIDEALDKGRIAKLNKLIGQHFSVGPDATNAINSLKGIIDDPALMSELKDLAKNDPDACSRPTIYRYVKKTQPDVLDNLDFGDMTMEDDTTDVVIGKDGAMKLAGTDDGTDKKASTEEIIEFVRSMYDKETGAFPKGETGVVISARKRFGDSVGDLVERFVSKLSGKKVNLDAENASNEMEEGENKDDDNEGFSDKEIKQAYGVLNDPRYKGGNLTGAAEVIEKIAKGLSKHAGVQRAMRATNETADLARIKKLAGMK